MSSFSTVDTHIHLYRSLDSATWWLNSYDVWEYGEKEDLQSVTSPGIIEHLHGLMRDGRIDHGVVANLFASREFQKEHAALRPDAERSVGFDAPSSESDPMLQEMFIDFNLWLVKTLQPFPQLTPFVAVDPAVLPPEQGVRHLEEMVRAGARGIKIHPVLQQFQPSDPRMVPIYEFCLEADLVVLSHSGRSRSNTQFAEPAAFAPVMDRFPSLRLVLAHMGGAHWRDVPALADAFPGISFDLSEIIHWTDATNAISAHDLANLILAVGPGRVMLGSDYPWYDFSSALDLLFALPLLLDEHKRGIAGGNAVRLLGVAL